MSLNVIVRALKRTEPWLITLIWRVIREIISSDDPGRAAKRAAQAAASRSLVHRLARTLLGTK